MRGSYEPTYWWPRTPTKPVLVACIAADNINAYSKCGRSLMVNEFTFSDAAYAVYRRAVDPFLMACPGRVAKVRAEKERAA